MTRRRRAGRERVDVHENPAVLDADRIRRKLLGKRRRRAAVVRPIRVAVPRAGDAAVDDPALSEWPALVGADVGDGGDRAAVLEDGDPFTGAGSASTLARMRSAMTVIAATSTSGTITANSSPP